MQMPSINSLVDLIVDETRIYRSRVEDESPGGRLTVAVPTDIGPTPLALGIEMDLSWVDGRHLNLVKVRLTDLVRHRPARWLLQITGEIRQENRRNYVRGAGNAPVAVERADVVDPDSRADGRVLDVSEGGVRLWVPSCSYGFGILVRVRMTLDAVLVDTTGPVLRIQEPGQGARGTEIVVSYNVGESVAQLIRRYVIAQQIADRRTRQYAD